MVDVTDFTVEKKYIFGNKQKLDQLFVIDNVSGLADKSNAFARFWTVSQKFKYSCVYIFHIIYPEKSIWKLILLQTKVFNTLKIILSNCIRETLDYLPQNSLRLNRHFVNLVNRSEKICLTLDFRGINPSNPGRFRPKANNP